MIKYVFLTCCFLGNIDTPMRGEHVSKKQYASEYKIDRIASIIVTVPTRRDDYNPAETCKTFVMTPKLARSFLLHSATALGSEAFHSDSFSSCESEGTVIFANGVRGEWLISRYGRGFLTITSGKDKDLMVYLHCYRCEDWKF